MRMTPYEFHLIRKRHKVERERQEFLLGIISQSIVNFSMGAPRPPARALDFMPSRWGRDETDEEILARLAMQMSDGAIVKG